MSMVREENMATTNRVIAERELLLQAWECIASERDLIYLSGPLTTGRRFVDWYLANGKSIPVNSRRYRDLHEKHVIAPNSKEIREMINALRVRFNHTILSPTAIRIPHWSQNDYRDLWEMVFDRFVRTVVLLPGWQYSAGASQEAYFAYKHQLDVITPDGASVDAQAASSLVSKSHEFIVKNGVPIQLGEVARLFDELVANRTVLFAKALSDERRKDEILFELGNRANIAQFISFAPTHGRAKKAYMQLSGIPQCYEFATTTDAIGHLIDNCGERMVNVRTFSDYNGNDGSKPFVYGLASAEEAAAVVHNFIELGLYVIVNETIDIHDSGVSGVVMGDVIEFSPDDLPRAVEKPGVCSLPRLLGIDLLNIVYGFRPSLDVPHCSRVEFSIHPKRRGLRNEHTILWEQNDLRGDGIRPLWDWPNRFSKFIGDKVFGLLVAHLIGLKVPRSIVISRRVAPFLFGDLTGSNETWFRTCPGDQVPGRFTTTHSWVDPFELMCTEDPKNAWIASVISQKSVSAQFSGAFIVKSDGTPRIQGVSGWGDRYMKGEVGPGELPHAVQQSVRDVYEIASSYLGPVRFEWVFDGSRAWIVQLHKGGTESLREWIVPGTATRWVTFDATAGGENKLEKLRDLLGGISGDTGLMIRGHVGMTSHIADVVRKAGIPARLIN